MPKQRSAAPAGPGGATDVPPPLPDLMGLDLRSLRGLEHPGLSAAVEDVLAHRAVFAEVWYSSEDAG